MEPKVLDDLAPNHPLHGLDLRDLSDERLAEAASRAILPDWVRMFRHIDYQEAAQRELFNISWSVIRRVTRVIVQRTRVVKLSEDRRLTTEGLDELLELTTLAFVQMVGAFDTLAVINGLLNGQSRYPEMAWQRASFRDAIRHTAPIAAELMDDGSSGAAYFRAIRAFRNTIHRRMPDIGTSGGYREPSSTEAILLLSENGHQEIIDAFREVGWTDFVGIDLVGDDWLFFRPHTVVGLLLSDGVPLLNQLLASTPVAALGPQRDGLEPNDSLWPLRMQEYAIEYLHLAHLLPAQREARS
ncbi:hypothetical protein SAMN06298212_10665 [Ruaniaceae bacterium KH17]|nr:hypothetical protein SAMN06298212_10665 [Ruaniaceae bacterium KH17]